MKKNIIGTLGAFTLSTLILSASALATCKVQITNVNEPRSGEDGTVETTFLDQSTYWRYDPLYFSLKNFGIQIVNSDESADLGIEFHTALEDKVIPTPTNEINPKSSETRVISKMKAKFFQKGNCVAEVEMGDSDIGEFPMNYPSVRADDASKVRNALKTIGCE